MKLFDLRSIVAPVSLDIEGAALADITLQTTALRLTPDIDAEDLAPYLDRLDLIVVTFPIFRDGRGFTQARTVREYFGFAGEIRAEGHLISDQAGFLRSCGVDTVLLPDDADLSSWERALELFPFSYQRRVTGA